jgi:hypothetical protein
MYGRDKWLMTEKEKLTLNMRERTIQRKVYGPKKGAGELKKQNLPRTETITQKS